MNTNRYTKACDVWALGVMLFMILSGEPPFNGATERAILESAQRGKFTFDSFVSATTKCQLHTVFKHPVFMLGIGMLSPTKAKTLFQEC